jgi:uncharacterized protein
MVDSLPKFIDPVALADKNARLTGSLSIVGFERLAEFLFHREGHAVIDLVFLRTDGRPKIEGQIDAVLQLKCQRCLESLEWSVHSDVHLGVVQSLNQADKLSQGFEPLMLDPLNKMVLADIVEDELLLNLPAIPKHSHVCLMLDNVNPITTVKHYPARENAFSKLAVLKQPENSNGSTKK